MSRCIQLTLLLVLLANGTTLGQGTSRPAPRKPEPLLFDVVFSNRSNVHMNLQVDHVVIDTIYGKLTVPIKDVHAIQFGMRFPTGTVDRIADAVKKLSAKDEGERAEAGKSLVELGPFSYAAALKVSQARDSGVLLRRRANDVLVKLGQRFSQKELTRQADDVVVTPTMTIVGQIQASTWKVRMEYFGNKSIDITKLRTVRNTAIKDERSDHEKIQGTWESTHISTDGRMENKRLSFTFAKDQLTVVAPNEQPEKPGTFKLGSTDKHKTIDLAVEQGLILLGIYQLDGDVLKLCLSHDGERPSSFVVVQGSDRILIHFKRKSAD